MVSKTITITQKAYDRLVMLKGKDESFTEVIAKLTERRPLSDFLGIMSNEEAEEMRRNIQSVREFMEHD